MTSILVLVWFHFERRISRSSEIMPIDYENRLIVVPFVQQCSKKRDEQFESESD